MFVLSIKQVGENFSPKLYKAVNKKHLKICQKLKGELITDTWESSHIIENIKLAEVHSHEKLPILLTTNKFFSINTI